MGSTAAPSPQLIALAVSETDSIAAELAAGNGTAAIVLTDHLIETYGLDVMKEVLAFLNTRTALHNLLRNRI
jgi:hypothetical protein